MNTDRMTAIYCVKTGQHVGQMLTSYEYPPHAVHPDWIATDGSNLDTMQDKDARAYVAFCLGLVDTFWRQKPQRGQKLNSRYMNKVDALEHHWALVKAYDLLGQVTDIHLRELANALCRFCTYAPLSYRVLDDDLLVHQRQADQLAGAAIDGSLLRSLEKATVRTLARAEGYARAGASVKTDKFEIKPMSIEDAAKGPSNIRAQAKSRDYVKNARTNKLMAELMQQFGGALGWANITPKRPQSSNLLARLSAGASLDHNVQRSTGSDSAERDLLDELEMHMGMGGSSTWSDDTDDDSDDDTVEMRFIPRAAVESLQEPVKVQEPAVSPVQEKPKLGMFARLAGKKE